MNIPQYKEAIRICMQAQLPLMAWGPGGVGKSQGAEQIAKEDKIDFLPIEAPLRDPTDFTGLPDTSGEYTVWKRPSILPEKGKGIMLIDELPDSPQMVMKALYHLILEHKVGGHIVPLSWYIMGAGNRPEDGGHSSPMPAPLITRFVHVGVYCEAPDFSDITPEKADVDVDGFIEWALAHLHTLAVAYLKFQPQHIYHHQAVPRTWEYISKLLTTIPNHHSFVFGELIKGAVGQGVGLSFNSFLKLAEKIPSIDALIKNPIKAPIPNETSILYAVVTALIQRVNTNNATNIIKYITRVPEEYQYYFFQSAIQFCTKLTLNPTYIDWINDNKKYLV